MAAPMEGRDTPLHLRKEGARESLLSIHISFLWSWKTLKCKPGAEQMHFILLKRPCCVVAITQSALMRTQTGTTHIFKWTRPERVTEQFPLFIEKGYCSATGFPLWLYPFFWRGGF